LTNVPTTSVEEKGIMCENNVLQQSVRNIVWYETNYDC
jgi:hypothetical protein